MARNIFISFLGTNNYSECVYVAEDKDGNKHEQKPCRYIQEATLRWLMESEGFAKGDSKAYILMTEMSRIKNWENDGHRDRETNAVIHQLGLEAIMSSIGVPYDAVKVPEGKDEKEILDIFRILYDRVQEGDRLYMDLTHGYRFMPMVMLVLGNYAKLLKKGVEIKAITYGNFEGRDKKTNKAPIVDLLQLSLIQDWAIAASQFINAGSAKMLKQLTTDALEPILKKKRGADLDSSALKKGMVHVGTLTNSLGLCRGQEVIKANALSSAIDNFEKVSNVAIEPLRPIFERLKAELGSLGNKNQASNCISSAKWCRDHGLFQQSISFVIEGVISVVLEKYGKDILNLDMRDAVSSALSVAATAHRKELEFDSLFNGSKLSAEAATFARAFGAVLMTSGFKECVMSYADSSIKTRNNVNHVSFKKESMNSDTIVGAIDKAIGDAESLLALLPDNLPSLPERSKLFLNISNHPSEKWGELQLAAAKALGEVADYPFPTVDQSASEEEIGKQADGMVKDIMDKWPDCDITAHIMGELTLTFALVRKLSAKGVKCVASTTERIVVDNPDGTKTSKFSFCQFRAFAI